MTEGNKTWAWTYDVRDRLKSITEPDQLPLSPTNPHTIEYEYDAVGNRTLMKTATQSVVYEFDNRNRLEEVRARKTGDVADQVTTYGYTDAGARDRQTHPNGTTVKYIYNPRHQLKEMLHKTAAGVLLLGITYQLDASGLRTEIAETGQTTRVANYEYDAQKRLTLESVKASPTGAFIRSQGYEYDPVGNRRVETKTVGATVEATTSTYDRNDRLKTATSVNSTVTYQYDANGRLESQVTAPASGATTTVAYGWDSRDRMTSSTSTSGIQSSTTKFSYDPDGTRIGQTQNAGTPQAKTIRYLVDRNQPYAQVVEERVFAGEATAPNMGALTNIYAFGNDLLTNTSCGAASTESNCAAADLRVLHYDGLGSTRFLINNSGATTDKYAYEAFGELDDSGSSGAFANNYKFTGEQLDSGLGFYYLRARYMNPGTGGFVSMDRMAQCAFCVRSLNKYLYVAADSINQVDPSGYMTLAEINTSLNEIGALRAEAYNQFRQGGFRAAGKILNQIGEKSETLIRKIITDCLKTKPEKIEFPGSKQSLDFLIEFAGKIEQVEAKSGLGALGGPAVRRLIKQFKTANANGIYPKVVFATAFDPERLTKLISLFSKNGVTIGTGDVINGAVAFSGWITEVFFELCIEK